MSQSASEPAVVEITKTRLEEILKNDVAERRKAIGIIVKLVEDENPTVNPRDYIKEEEHLLEICAVSSIFSDESDRSFEDDTDINKGVEEALLVPGLIDCLFAYLKAKNSK